MVTFDKPFNLAASRDTFGMREVGLNHPDNKTFIKLGDDGNIELMVTDGFGMIFDAYSRSINIYADAINIHTKQVDGFRWNRLSFNHRATKYTEPPFVEMNVGDIRALFDGVEDIVGKGKVS